MPTVDIRSYPHLLSVLFHLRETDTKKKKSQLFPLLGVQTTDEQAFIESIFFSPLGTHLFPLPHVPSSFADLLQNEPTHIST